MSLMLDTEPRFRTALGPAIALSRFSLWGLFNAEPTPTASIRAPADLS